MDFGRGSKRVYFEMFMFTIYARKLVLPLFAPLLKTGICGFGFFPIWHFAIDINSVNAPKCCNLGQAAISCTGKTDFILLDVTLDSIFGSGPTSDA